jgi:hypothetical protein
MPAKAIDPSRASLDANDALVLTSPCGESGGGGNTLR